MRVIVRTSVEPSSLISGVRAAIQSIDRDEGPTRIASMTQLLSASVAQPRFNSFLIGLLGGLAFLLAIVGIYGVISYEVAQRTNEIGIRMALGAASGDVMRMILTQGLWLTLGGLVVGIGAAIGLTRFLRELLFEVTPTDPATYVAVSLLLIG